MIKIKSEVKECDVLVVGGGMAGLMAAIAAADGGAKVIVCDKTNTLRSGSGATGNDHFTCYLHDSLHKNMTIDDWLIEFDQSQVGGYSDPTIQRVFGLRTFEVVKDWGKWGIDMKPSGTWECLGHSFPGRPRIWLKYNGFNQKAILTAEAKKRKVVIENHSPVTEYLKDDTGKICGVIAIDISELEPMIKLYKAKAVISATGNTNRLYSPITGGMMFNTAWAPCNAGGGIAAAYRIGAELVNMEMPNTHAGPKYMERAGKATWIGVLTDPNGTSVGPFVEKPTKELGDITADVWHSVFKDKIIDGSGPVFMNCTTTSQDDLDYMMWALACEGDTSIIDAMEKQGINLHKDIIEFTQYEPMLIGRGIQIDEHAATNITGLYAAGDSIGNFRSDMAGAAVMGRIAGESAAEYVKNINNEIDIFVHPMVRQCMRFYDALMERKKGSSWQELNMAIQQIMDDYAGINNARSENLLSTGIKYLTDLKKLAEQTVMCKDSHQLMRALESFDLLLVGKLVCTAALERKETRGNHRRSDYTFTNPLLNDKFIVVQNVEGRAVCHWRNKY